MCIFMSILRYMHVKLGELGDQKRALDPLGLECLGS